MRFKTKLFLSALLLMLPLTFTLDAYAHNDGKGSNSSNNNNNNNGRGNDRDHDWDNEWDRYNDHDWDNEWDRDWDKSWNGSWKKDWDDWKKSGWGASHGSKIFICHRTSSGKNPYVLIQVSTSAKQAHYNHGDPVQFTDKSNGRCGPSTPPPPPAPTVSLSLAASQIFMGATTTATWTSTHATSCKLNGTVTSSVNDSALVGSSYTSTGDKTVTITCTGAGGSDTDTKTLKVKSPPAPTVSLSLAASQINVGATTTANWTSSHATSCKLGSTTVGVSGPAPVGPYTSTGDKTITITCTGPGGTDSDSKTLKVKAAPPAVPTVSVTLAPREIAIGAQAKLSWSSNGATSCKLSGVGSLYARSFSISIDTSGFYMKGPFSAAGQATYTVTCTGPGGTTTGTETLTVKAPTPPPSSAPTVTWTLAANTINTGGTTTATWSSQNATSCSKVGTAAAATSGSVQVGPYQTTGVDEWFELEVDGAVDQAGPSKTTGPVTLSITCTGANGATTTATAQLNVVMEVCAFSDLGGGAEITWIVAYNPATGAFVGDSEGPLPSLISGDVTPPAGMPVANALFTTGSTLSFSTRPLPLTSTGVGVTGSGNAWVGQASGAAGLSLFDINVVGPLTTTSTTFSFAGWCGEMDVR